MEVFMGRPFYDSDEALENDLPIFRKPEHRETMAPRRSGTVTPPRRDAVAPPAAPPPALPAKPGPGSWANPRVRARDGVATRATSVHLPIDLAEQLDAVRLKTHRRLSDLLVEAARMWLRGRP
jgi:hypothetical protein